MLPTYVCEAFAILCFKPMVHKTFQNWGPENLLNIWKWRTVKISNTGGRMHL